MNEREYLRHLGYEVGERGRFSTEMKDELAKRDYKPSPQEVFKPEVKPEREGRQLYGYDKQGNKIAFVICYRCTQHMVWCRCVKGVHAPRYIYSSKDPLVFVPPYRGIMEGQHNYREAPHGTDARTESIQVSHRRLR